MTTQHRDNLTWFIEILLALAFAALILWHTPGCRNQPDLPSWDESTQTPIVPIPEPPGPTPAPPKPPIPVPDIPTPPAQDQSQTHSDDTVLPSCPGGSCSQSLPIRRGLFRRRN